MNVGARIEGVRERLRADRSPAAVIALVSNMKYLTAFDNVIDRGISAACLVTETDSVFYTDNRYIEAARAAAEGGP